MLACTAGFSTPEGWAEHYASWTSADTLAGKMQAFIDGAATFVAALGVPMEVAQALIALVAVSFALTSLDSGTRLLRYNIEEIASSIGATFIERYSASLIAVALIGFFAFYEINGQPAGLALWALFGSTNQILGALTLLTVVVYLRQRKANYWPYLIPMAFMMVVTVVAMVINLEKYWASGNVLLTFVAASIFGLSIWLAVEAYLRIRKDSDESAVAAAVEGD